MTNSRNRNYQLPATNCKLLILSLSGIGNYLMHTPFVEQVKKQRPHWRITVWCAPRGQAELARANPNISSLIERPMQSPFLKDLTFLVHLRRRRFNAAVMLSPGQRLKGAAYLAAAGIPQRLTHQYPLLVYPRSSFLLTRSIPERAGLHDIEQNLALLPLLVLDNPSLTTNYSLPTTNYSLVIPPESQQKAATLLSTLNISSSRPLVAIHPGSAVAAAFKRWPLVRFAELARTLITKHNAHLLILGGKAEKELKQNLTSQLTAYRLSLTDISVDLLTTAAILQRCRLFIGNDSGLMHLSAAVGTPTIGLFGPTDERQVGPRGPRSQALRAPGTRPVYDTEKNWQLGNKPHHTLAQLSAEQVVSAAMHFLEA